MKNGLLIWNIVLTLAAGYLLFIHFTSNKKADPLTKTASTSPAAVNSSFRIAYFDMDSVENNFLMVKDVQAEINQKEKEYNNQVAGLDMRYKNKLAVYQQKDKTTPMTPDEVDKAKIDLKQFEDQLKSEKQVLDQDYQDFVMHRQLGLKTAIADYLKEYNKASVYSYILVYAADLIYYKDTAYNITADVIKGLNEWYRNKKK